MFPRMRRALGILSMVLMFHLTLVGGDVACAKHGETASLSGHAMQDPNAHHHGHPAGQHSEQAGQCDTPVSPDCCSAQAPCAPTLEVAEVLAFPEPILATRIVPTSSESSALLRFTAPETPPPRA